MSTSVLMIAYHFPPCAEVSGVLRTLSMANHLVEAGYSPIILAPRGLAFPDISERSPKLSDGCHVVRTLALDAARHTGLFGRYPKHLALPDRWVSWQLTAVPKGLHLIKRYRPKVIWSTYPIATSHLIANILHRMTGIPWIADFRDPMVLEEPVMPAATRVSRGKLESVVIRNAQTCAFVTRHMMTQYEEKYEGIPHGEFVLLPNGFDEESFAEIATPPLAVPTASVRKTDGNGTAVRLVHSGLLYPAGRNPRPFFQALANLSDSGRVCPETLQIVLRASGSDRMFARMIEELGLGGIVELAPRLERPEALRELYGADGLLLFQGREFNAQVPAKIYEYLKVGKPIFALLDHGGETAEIMSREHSGLSVDLENVEDIESGLLQFIAMVNEGAYRGLSEEALSKYSRSVGAKGLVRVIDGLISG